MVIHSVGKGHSALTRSLARGNKRTKVSRGAKNIWRGASQIIAQRAVPLDKRSNINSAEERSIHLDVKVAGVR